MQNTREGNVRFYRGDIVHIGKRDVRGSEQSGNRYGVVVSNAAANRYSPVLEIVLLTTAKKKPIPTHATITSAPLPSIALCEQVISQDRACLKRTGRRCSESEMDEVNRCLAISLGLISW